MPTRTLILCALIAVATGQAQEPAAPIPLPSATPAGEPAKPRKADRPAASDRERHERAMREMIQKLPPENRRQVLQAMRKVWADDDVRAAREDLRRATDSYRRTLRAAMEEADPEVRDAMRPLLDQLLKSGLKTGDGTGASRPEKSSGDGSPRFLRLLGLSGDKATALTPDERALLGSVRERVMTDPRVRQAATTLAAKPDQSGGRGPALQALRRTTRAVAVEIEPRLQPLLEKVAAPPERPAGGLPGQR